MLMLKRLTASLLLCVGVYMTADGVVARHVLLAAHGRNPPGQVTGPFNDLLAGLDPWVEMLLGLLAIAVFVQLLSWPRRASLKQRGLTSGES